MIHVLGDWMLAQWGFVVAESYARSACRQYIFLLRAEGITSGAYRFKSNLADVYPDGSFWLTSTPQTEWTVFPNDLSFKATFISVSHSLQPQWCYALP